MELERTKQVAIIYARYSSDRQNAITLDSQISYCRDYCWMRHYEIVGDYCDRATSGKTLSGRPGFEAALNHVKQRQGILVFYSLSRAFRSTKDALLVFEELDQAGAYLCSVKESFDTNTAAGRFVFRVLAALAELEREQIIERTVEAMISHQRNGRRMGGICPYGWVDDETCTELNQDGRPRRMRRDLREQAAIARVLELHTQGTKLRRIARILDEEGYPPRGACWNHGVVQRIIARAAEDHALQPPPPAVAAPGTANTPGARIESE